MTDVTFVNCSASRMSCRSTVSTGLRLEGVALAGSDWTSSTMSDCDFVACSLERAKFSGLRAFRVRFDHVDGMLVEAPAAVWLDSAFVSSRLPLADLSRSHCKDTRFDHSDFSRSTFSESLFESSGAQDTGFDFCDLSRAFWSGCFFATASIVGSNCEGLRAANCSFVDTDFYWSLVGPSGFWECQYQGVRWDEANPSVCHSGKPSSPSKPIPTYRRPVVRNP